MTEEERREMTRRNYAAQMEMMGYDASGNPLDMVHVVRCKDCRWGEWTKNCRGEDVVICNNTWSPISETCGIVKPNWYCADGERRDEDAKDN